MLAAYASLPARAIINDTGITLMTWGLIIAGILMLGSAFLPKLKTGQRVAGVIFGILFIGYGIYVSLPSTHDVFISFYMFIVPVAVLVTNISASVKGNKSVEVQNHGPAGYYPPQGQQPYQGQNPQQPVGQAPYGQQYQEQQAQPGYPAQTGQQTYGQPAAPQPYQGQAAQPVQPGQAPQPSQYQQPTDPTA